jgi:hypothetical protein
MVNDWCWGYSMAARCPACAMEIEVFWDEGRPARLTQENTFKEIGTQPLPDPAMLLDVDFAFDDEQLARQIISLAAASGHVGVERQMRLLFGTVECYKCGLQLSYMRPFLKRL